MTFLNLLTIGKKASASPNQDSSRQAIVTHGGIWNIAPRRIQSKSGLEPTGDCDAELSGVAVSMLAASKSGLEPTGDCDLAVWL